MLKDILCNPVCISVVILMVLSILRLNVVFSLIIAAISGGLIAGIGEAATMKAFAAGLGNGANIAFNYAMLGAFSIAISRSGITELLADLLFKKINKSVTPKSLFIFKYSLIIILTLAAVSSQNVIPIHIAFIPILIPPLLEVFEKIRLDRRMVACILTFGLITPYMVLPFGFGRIYLNEILIKNITTNGLQVTADMAPKAMFIPALGMIAGLLIAVFISYRKPRNYDRDKIRNCDAVVKTEIKPLKVCIGVIAIAVGLAGQLWLDSLVIASLAGIIVFVISGVISIRDTQDVFTKGIYMMGGIGIVMIGASGFAEVMKATGGVDSMVAMITNSIGDQRGLAVFLMLLIGLLITMGIGSSFSTVPLIAAIYVPLCIKLGISPLATIAIVGVAGALGDAGSPVSESVLGPTAGLNADGQHDHIFDSTIPTFIHYNIPLLIAGWIAGMIL
ncbi:MAG: TRAP transporter large permease subunit [Lentisphaeria bacterium]|nr:TRAP transporter large permease subunit [Lentisphaeria bacterium]